MSIDILLASLTDYLKAEKDHANGQAELAAVTESKNRLNKALVDWFSYRFNQEMYARHSQKSQERIDMASTINATVKTAASTIKTLKALNSAPPPPASNDPDEYKKWLEEYKKWYDDSRKGGLEVT